MGLSLDALGGWPAVLRALMAGEDLPAEDAAAALTDILEGRATPAQIAAFITLMRAKGETVEEMTALVRTMLRFAEPVPVPVEVLDTCGSGGSEQRRQGAFNVSTLTALVVAGAGVAVAKHGGRAASATSSSADVLAALGVTVELGPAGVVRCVEEAGMGFCFAPRFHPAMRHAAPVRAELGVPTLFNFVAPMANPARPRRQVLGVSEPRLAETMLSVLHRNGATGAMVVHGDDGLDELTTTTTSTVVELREDGEVRRYTVDPSDLGLTRAAPADLRGGDAAANAALARRVLAGEAGPHRDIVVLNAAAGLVVAGRAADLAGGLERARASIDRGEAAAVLDRLVKVSAAAAAAAGA